MKNRTLILILIFISTNVFAQQRITKSSIKQTFRESKDKKRNGRFHYPTDNTWKFNNKDSIYFKQDTLIAIFYKAGKRKDLCESVTWTFHRNDEFVMHKEFLCKEPPTISALKFPNDYYKIAVYEVDNEVMIDFLRLSDKMIMDSFHVIKLEKTNTFNKIILRRRSNYY